MPKFHITASFELSTEVEPDLYGEFDRGDTEDFSDDSSFGTGYVEVDGGQVSFVIEADDEDRAESKAEDVIYSGHEVTDRNGLTWMIDNVRFDIEPVEEPMTKERAKEIVMLYLSEVTLPDDVKEAFRFLLSEV